MNTTKNALQPRLYTLSEACTVLKTMDLNTRSTFKPKETIIEGLVKEPKISTAPKS